MAYFGNRDGLELLIRHEELFDMELKDRCGRTALDLACFQGEAACVRCLVRAGANCRSQDSVDGRTPVHAAAYNNHLECLKALHECDDESSLCGVGDKGGGGCHIKLGNMRDRFGRTPLMYATEQGHLNLFNYLINRLGADVLVCDNKKRSALHRAACLGYEECCQYLLKSNPSTSLQRDINGLLPIHFAVMGGHANLISLLFDYIKQKQLEENEDEDERDDGYLLLDNGGFSLLHLACFNGHSTCVETICELVELPQLLNVFYPHSTRRRRRRTSMQQMINKFTPLHCACYNSHEACVSFLLDRFGRDIVNAAIDYDGNTALHICAMHNEYESAGLILGDCEDVSNDGDNDDKNENDVRIVDWVNKRGETALHLAAKFNSFSVLELLLKRRPTKKQHKQKKQQPLNATIEFSPNKKRERRRARLDVFDLEGNSALHLALANKNENCALFILDELTENSPLINAQNKDGDTPLHIAAANGFVTSVEILLNKNADVWLKNSSGKTPLLNCARDNQVAECLELMLSRLIIAVSTSTSTTATTSNSATITNHHHHNKTYTPLKYAINCRSANNTPKINEHIIDRNNEDPNSSLIVTSASDIILNDDHMNPLGDFNSSLNNLNSTLISNNENETMNGGEQMNEVITNSNETNVLKKSFDENNSVINLIDSEFY